MPRKRSVITVERIQGSGRRVEAQAWQQWLEEAGQLLGRFDYEEWDDPFAYNETASVSLLAAAAARIGALTLAEFSVTKKGFEDSRTRSNGRADFWMRMPKGRAWSFEFKQITFGAITAGRLREQMAAANKCASKLLRYGPEHLVAGLIVPLYYVEAARRGKARGLLEDFAVECDFAWHLHAPNEGPETFLFFDIQK